MSLVFNNKRIGFNGKRLAKPSGQSGPVLIYSNNTENTATGADVSYNINLGNSNYTLFQITQKTVEPSSFGACDMWIEFDDMSGSWPAHSEKIWRFRSHYNWSKYQPIRCCQLYTNENPADWCDNLQTNCTRRSPQDNETCYYYNQSSPSATTYAVHSLLINNSTGIAKHFVDGNYTCNGNLVTNGKFNAISKVSEINYYYSFKDIYIYGCDNEEDLLSIIAGTYTGNIGTYEQPNEPDDPGIDNPDDPDDPGLDNPFPGDNPGGGELG